MESLTTVDVTSMGLDGGTRITRSDVLRGQSWRLTTRDTSRSTRGGSVSTQDTVKESALDKKSARLIKWTTCTLSEQPFQLPVVSDFLGNLYNKQALWQFLLNRKGVFKKEEERHFFTNVIRAHGAQFHHIQSRRDVFELRIDASHLTQDHGLSCSVSGLHALSVPFSAIASCGHCFSDRALEQMKDRRCMECSQSFTTMDVIHLNTEDATKIAVMTENLKKRQKTHEKEHSRKRKAAKQNARDNKAPRGDEVKGDCSVPSQL